ncbi:MAG: FecR domain-containing protein, partial [Gammaproteobacteria bacterium]|nr:FecR domain-containing protein [Gammaproteobacteria bacterium]
MRFLGIILVLLMLFSAPAKAAPCPEWVAKAVSIQGTVELRMSKVIPDSAKRWTSVKRGDTFCANDVVRVKANSRAALILTNDTVLRLDQNSTISFTNLSSNKASQLNLSQGVAHFISRVKQAFEVVTPFVNAAVEGTEFVVAANNNHSHVTVLEGKVRVSNPSGEILLAKNQVAVAKNGQAPVLDIKLKPRDTVQWALYYPNIIDTTSSSSQNLVNRAASKLALGRVKEAFDDLNNIAISSSSYTEALALKAIIALVNNDKSEANALATQAYERDKQNVSAILAMSYVQQAHFNIHAALEPLLQYSKLNALVYARMAEVYLMLGDLDNAFRHAKHAVKLDNKLSKSQAVLGYANLTRNNAKNAELNFKIAIELDQADPLPHLGLGLALIRQGQLEQGRREIEYAASLDPNNALIRSYLGKAYYEEKRDKVATDQFDMAKELDAKDPTAWFYSAIQKQSNNRQVEALQDLQTSAELNDNRAVYRSRLLLDEDQAARSSGLARIYSDLGFEQLAQQQAFNSINQDFTNHSAHRFLAESYANRSRHEIGRVSELLQSQLLAPINVSPVAPHLSETQLGIQPNAGPSGASFNQYDPLFARNQSRLQVSA